MADPFWVRKAAEGRADEINTCIGCNQACLDHTFKGKVRGTGAMESGSRCFVRTGHIAAAAGGVTVVIVVVCLPYPYT